MSSSQAQTSIAAFKKKQQDGSLTGDRKRVYQTVKRHGPISCKATARRLNKFPNEISGRFTELRNQDLIEIVGTENGHRQYEVKNR